MSNVWMVGIGLAALALAHFGIRAVRRRLRRNSPYRFKKKKLMTPNEQEFYGRIVKAVEGRHTVLCQVSMGALMTGTHVSGNHVRARMKFAQKIVDFALMDTAGNICLLIELDDRMHDRKKDLARDAMTREAGYRTLRFESRHKPSVQELRKAIYAAL